MIFSPLIAKKFGLNFALLVGFLLCVFSLIMASLAAWADSRVENQLKKNGHNTFRVNDPHGGGQAIRIDWKNGLLIGGSDQRKDGCALGL